MTMTTVYTTREEWLTAAGTLLEPLFIEAGLTPAPARASVGFPVGTRGRNKTIGQCHYAAADGVPQIFIHPTLVDPVEVLATLAHELVHAYLPVGTSHKRPFAIAVQAIGLEGKPTATVAGEEFKATAAQLIEVLGDYPHAALDHSGVKKQTTRQLLAECPRCEDEGEPYKIRLSRAQAERGLPYCGLHDEEVLFVLV